MPAAKLTPSQAELMAMFDYDPETGALTWRHRSDRRTQWNGRFAGKRAGGISKSNGRWMVNVGYELFLAYRLIWKMVYGMEAPADIDHHDGDPSNDRLKNLRSATKHQNLRNSKLHRGKMLPKGVSEYRCGGYRAAIFINGGQKYLGHFDTVSAAHDAYKTAAAAAFGEFARFG